TITSEVTESGTLASEATESGTIASEATESGTIASEATESGTITSEATESGIIISEATESGSIAPKATENGTIASEATENGTIASEATESGTITSEATESGTITSEATESGTITSEVTESGTRAPKATESGTIASAAPDSGTIASEATESETIASEARESGTVTSEATESGTITSESKFRPSERGDITSELQSKTLKETAITQKIEPERKNKEGQETARISSKGSSEKEDCVGGDVSAATTSEDKKTASTRGTHDSAQKRGGKFTLEEGYEFKGYILKCPNGPYDYAIKLWDEGREAPEELENYPLEEEEVPGLVVDRNGDYLTVACGSNIAYATRQSFLSAGVNPDLLVLPFSRLRVSLTRALTRPQEVPAAAWVAHPTQILILAHPPTHQSHPQ
ncbi:hypothetical protein OTU49_009490, partial [Cherax quadricarinatus]